MHRRTWLLLPAGLSLLAGLDAGLLLLDLPAPVTATHLTSAHGVLMVLGFLGTLISLERAVALRAPWAYAAPALLGAGGLALVAGPRLLGQVLLIDGMVAFLVVASLLWRRQRDGAVAVEVLAVTHGLATAILWTRIEVAPLLALLVGFVVLTIAAERVELARLQLGRAADVTLLGFAGAYAVSALASLLWPFIGSRLVAASLLGLVARMVRHDVARRMIRSSGLPRYSAAAMLAGWAWLSVAALTWLVTGPPTGRASYDVIVHGVFLGFAMSMVLAHAPVILPAVIRRPLPYRPLLWLPLGVLHGSLLARIAGDATGLDPLWQAGGVGTVLALLLLPVTAIISMLLPPPPPRTPSPHGIPRATHLTPVPAAAPPPEVRP